MTRHLRSRSVVVATALSLAIQLALTPCVWASDVILEGNVVVKGAKQSLVKSIRITPLDGTAITVPVDAKTGAYRVELPTEGFYTAELLGADGKNLGDIEKILSVAGEQKEGLAAVGVNRVDFLVEPQMRGGSKTWKIVGITVGSFLLGGIAGYLICDNDEDCGETPASPHMP